MLNKEDYEEPRCPLSRPHPDRRAETPDGHLNMAEVIRQCDRLAGSGRVRELGEFLRSKREEARRLRDRSGELSIVNELIGYCRMNQLDAEGQTAIADALNLLTELDLAGEVTCGTVQLNIATALCAFGNPRQALRHYEEASRCYGQHLPPEDPRYAGLFNNMAAAYADCGEFKHAEACYRQALKLQEAAGKPSCDLAVTCVNLAQFYGREDADAPAVAEYLERAMTILDDPALPRDGYYAHTCSKCAGAYGYFGFFLDERELRRRAEEITAGGGGK